MIRVAADAFDPAAELAAFEAEARGAGAIVSFVGTVRGGGTQALALSHYPGFTEAAVEQIAAETRARFEVTAVAIVHRVGSLEPGEPIVFAAAAAPHRRAAFDAVDYLMDRLKTDAPFWKREIGAEGERWIEPRPQDHRDRSRWESAGATRIDQSLPFVPVRIAVLTISDTRTPETDSSGDLLAQRILAAGHTLHGRRIVSDAIEAIRAAVRGWADDRGCDVVISTGGTGLTGRDVTPEAVRPLLDKVIEGFAAVFHQVSRESVGLSTLQSRALAGIASGSFVFCLPGSNGAVKDGWDKVISHQLDSRYRPCNLVEIMPRLREQ